MIKTKVSAQLECLQSAGIRHDLFIGSTGCELHLWDYQRFSETLIILESRDVVIDSIVKIDAEAGDWFYTIKF